MHHDELTKVETSFFFLILRDINVFSFIVEMIIYTSIIRMF